MKLKESCLVTELAALVGAKVLGDASLKVEGLNEIHKVEPGDVMFVDVAKYFNKAFSSQATFILINEEVAIPEGKCLLFHPNPFEAYNKLVAHFYDTAAVFDSGNPISKETNIHPEAVIHSGVVIGSDVRIGKGSIIYPNVVIYDRVSIGENVIIHSGSIIGGQAFYYGKKDGQYVKWHSCGSVIIEDNVEIGALCSIDKGVSGITRIGQGSKLDNQIHIGHGVEMGKNCLIAAQVGIGGKSILEDDVICWGQVGITKDVRIGKGAILMAQSGVSKSLKGGKSYFGSPAQEAKKAFKELATIRQAAALK